MSEDLTGGRGWTVDFDKVDEVSVGPEELRGLLLLCFRHDTAAKDSPPLATTDQLATREHLRGFVLDSYVQRKPGERLRRHPILTAYVMNGGNARAAARTHGYDPADDRHRRKIQRWADEYLEFAAEKLAELVAVRARARRRHERSFQAAELQCYQQCGRDRDGGGPMGSGGGGGCPSCPMRWA